MICFDHNATGPLLPEAREAWLAAVRDFPGNPSSPHRLGARADRALEGAREELASLLGCSPTAIVWTSGATESNNMVARSFARRLPSRGEALVSAIEHPSLLAPALERLGSRCRLIPCTADGVIDLDWLQGRLKRRRPGVVAVMAANNETGVLQPWREVLALCREREVPFLCDAVQWLGRRPARGLGDCDFVVGSGHKFGGPRGVGFVTCPPATSIEPLLCGGKQEGGLRAGTENVAGALAMVAALRSREARMKNPGPAPETLRVRFEQRLCKEIPGITVVGGNAPRLWNTVMVLAPESACPQRWVVRLDKLGFAASTGSACASGAEQPSHVLLAMGCTADQASRALRLSSGWETTARDWDALLDALRKIGSARGVGRRSGSCIQPSRMPSPAACST